MKWNSNDTMASMRAGSFCPWLSPRLVFKYAFTCSQDAREGLSCLSSLKRFNKINLFPSWGTGFRHIWAVLLRLWDKRFLRKLFVSFSVFFYILTRHNCFSLKQKKQSEGRRRTAFRGGRRCIRLVYVFKDFCRSPWKYCAKIGSWSSTNFRWCYNIS